MCDEKQTGWFLHLGRGRQAGVKKDYARTADGRRMVFTDDEAQAALVEARKNYLAAHLRPAFGPMPTSRVSDAINQIMAAPKLTPAQDAADRATLREIEAGVLDPATVDAVVDLLKIENEVFARMRRDGSWPLNPALVTDDQYDAMTLEQREVQHRNLLRTPGNYEKYPPDSSVAVNCTQNEVSGN